MAQKVQVVLVDDLDGGTADETVTFSLDGVSYEIDLTHDNAARAARPARALRRPRPTRRRRRAAPRPAAGAPRARAPAGSTPPRCARGPRARASRSTSAAASAPTCTRSTRPPTADSRDRARPSRRRARDRRRPGPGRPRRDVRARRGQGYWANNRTREAVAASVPGPGCSACTTAPRRSASPGSSPTAPRSPGCATSS